MNINYTNNTIEMTNTEAKTAGKLNSEKFIELKALKVEVPTARIVIVKSSAKKGDHFKGLTYDYMKNYIENHDTEDQSVMAVFNELCGRDENGKKLEMAAAASYGEVKMWFLTQYPEIEKMNENVNKIIEAVRKVRTDKKAA